MTWVLRRTGRTANRVRGRVRAWRDAATRRRRRRREGRRRRGLTSTAGHLPVAATNWRHYPPSIAHATILSQIARPRTLHRHPSIFVGPKELEPPIFWPRGPLTARVQNSCFVHSALISFILCPRMQCIVVSLLLIMHRTIGLSGA